MEPALPSSFEEKPAPWVLHGQAWWFMTSLGGKLPLTPGNFHPLEASSEVSATENGAFVGGMATVQIIRYKESPVGPYDELIYVPGDFKLPVELQRRPNEAVTRISRIYVSTLASVANGRRNWNVPKHLARFQFDEVSAGVTEVRVFAATSSNAFQETPLFSARLSRSSLPAIPFNTRYMPLKLHLAQPPLEASSNAAEDGLVGTKTWKYISLIAFQGRAKLATIEGLLDVDEREGKKGKKRVGDGQGFPDVEPYSLGLEWLEPTRVDFGAPEVLGE